MQIKMQEAQTQLKQTKNDKKTKKVERRRVREDVKTGGDNRKGK
jgi:hypothetical protein